MKWCEIIEEQEMRSEKQCKPSPAVFQRRRNYSVASGKVILSVLHFDKINLTAMLTIDRRSIRIEERDNQEPSDKIMREIGSLKKNGSNKDGKKCLL